MNILNSLTIKSLKLNKKRTIVTIIGIMLSVALICAITTFVSSFQNSLINMTKITNGNYSINIGNLNKEESKYILNNTEIDYKYIYKDIGYSKLKNPKNEYKTYLFLSAFDKSGMDNMGLNLISGRFPENSNEVIVSEHINKIGGMDYKIGDVIELDIGKRKLFTGEELNQNNPISIDINNNILEEITNTKKKTVEIVGIIERPYIENYSAPGYTIITLLDDKIKDENDKINVAATLKKPQNTYKFGEKLMTDYSEKYNNLRFESPNISYNDELLRFQGITKSDSTMDVLVIMASIVIVIIIFTSVFVIKNSFNISITERLKQYGMLASIGATSKQLKRNIKFEGIILGLIAIPLGVALGIFSIWIVLLIVNSLLSSINIAIGFDLTLSVSFVSILIAVIISAITIYISTILPARRASKISAIDAIRESKDVKITRKKLKTSKLFKKIFGIEGEIASKNLKRSKSKYRTTVFSICISVVLFISISSFIEYGFKINSLYYEKTDANIIVFDSNNNYKSVPEYFKNITRLNNIEEYSIIKDLNASMSISDYASKDALDTYLEGELEEFNIRLIAIGELEYKNYIKKLGLKYEDIKDKVILVDEALIIKDEKRKEINSLKVKSGDNVLISEYDPKEKKYENKEVTIGIRTDKLPLGLQKSTSSSIIMIMSDEKIEEFNYKSNNMYIKSLDPYKLQEDIIKLEESKKDNITNIDESVREENAMVLIISIFLYGFVAVISVISITNIFNTITTNMALREREFAILKSIGMTNKEFKKMINFESMLYGIKALIFGLPIGVFISYLIYQTMSNIYETKFMLPFSAILICIIFVFITIFSTMKYSINKAKNKNIIEVIRKENI